MYLAVGDNPGGTTPEYRRTLTDVGMVDPVFQVIFETVSVPNIKVCVIPAAGVAGVATSTGGVEVGKNS
jgi:hypothetical protein